MPLSGATAPGQSGPGSDGNEVVLRIPQSSNTAGTSPSDCLSVINRTLVGGVLPLCRGAVGLFYSPSRQGEMAWQDDDDDEYWHSHKKSCFILSEGSITYR